MPDFGFALDGLYAAGWWPSDGDHCLKNRDGRWYPDEQFIIEAFKNFKIAPEIRHSAHKGVTGLAWISPRGGRHTVIAQTRTEAMIMAFTMLLGDQACMHSIS